MTKILCVGDLHLGRVPGVSQQMCEQTGLTPQMLSPTAAWRRIVDYACQALPDAVISVGDIIDKDNCFYEAFGPLEQGLKRLQEAGIPVYAVAGNHDGYSLPRMTRSLPNFRLIGQGARWETVALPDQSVRLVGWSFTGSSEPSSPLSTFEAVRDEIQDSPVPVIGLLHCDLDMAISRYAPVSSAELRATGVDAWLLGHIHKPSDMAGEVRPLFGYLGSCVGLDPTETGPRGPWMLDITAGGAFSMTHLPLAPLRWETHEVSVDGIADIDELDGLVIGKIGDLLREPELARHEPKAIGCRLRFTGKTSIRQDILRRLTEIELLHKEVDGRTCFVDKADGTSLRPELDLEVLRNEETPLGLLAARLWDIDQKTEDGQRYVREALPCLVAEASNRAWLPIEQSSLTDEEVRLILLDTGLNALEALRSQKRA